jgi:hypothetical protein
MGHWVKRGGIGAECRLLKAVIAQKAKAGGNERQRCLVKTGIAAAVA